MKLIVLGSGTSVPHPQRASAAHWLETPGGSLLLDLSADAPHRMAQEKLNWAHLDAVWISHFHLDHLGGLAPFLFGTKYAPQTQGRTKPLTIHGPQGLGEIIRRFDEANDYGLLAQPFPVVINEVTPNADWEILPGLRAQTCSTPHTPDSLALRVTDAAGASLVYTSDTGYADHLVAFARGVELLLTECSFPRDKPIATHLELADAMRLAAAAAPRRVVLAHLYPDWDGLDLAAAAAQLWNGETIEARDGLRLEL